VEALKAAAEVGEGVGEESGEEAFVREVLDLGAWSQYCTDR
jgi:hypothetical protein